MGGEQYIVRFQVCGQAQAWLRGEDVPAMHSPRGLYQLVLSANLPANDFETMPIVQPGGLQVTVQLVCEYLSAAQVCYIQVSPGLP